MLLSAAVGSGIWHPWFHVAINGGPFARAHRAVDRFCFLLKFEAISIPNPKIALTSLLLSTLVRSSNSSSTEGYHAVSKSSIACYDPFLLAVGRGSFNESSSSSISCNRAYIKKAPSGKLSRVGGDPSPGFSCCCCRRLHVRLSEKLQVDCSQGSRILCLQLSRLLRSGRSDRRPQRQRERGDGRSRDLRRNLGSRNRTKR